MTLVNNWLSNDGSVIPSVLRIGGILRDESPSSSQYDWFGFFFDDALQFNAFVDIPNGGDSGA